MKEAQHHMIRCTSTALIITAGLVVDGCSSPPHSVGTVGTGAVARARILARPSYPEVSILAKHQGVAVVAISVNENNVVSTASVLQAPDKDIAESAMTAARATTFVMPQLGKGRQLITGKMIYYFELNPHPHVEIAMQPK